MTDSIKPSPSPRVTALSACGQNRRTQTLFPCSKDGTNELTLLPHLVGAKVRRLRGEKQVAPPRKNSANSPRTWAPRSRAPRTRRDDYRSISMRSAIVAALERLMSEVRSGGDARRWIPNTHDNMLAGDHRLRAFTSRRIRGPNPTQLSLTGVRKVHLGMPMQHVAGNVGPKLAEHVS